MLYTYSDIPHCMNFINIPLPTPPPPPPPPIPRTIPARWPTTTVVKYHDLASVCHRLTLSRISHRAAAVPPPRRRHTIFHRPSMILMIFPVVKSLNHHESGGTAA